MNRHLNFFLLVPKPNKNTTFNKHTE